MRSLQMVAWMVLLLLPPVVIRMSDAACKNHDASWEGSRGPVVTQPSRSDATKVKVDWGSIIKNARCVDDFIVMVWKSGTDKSKAEQIRIPNKSTTSYIAQVEACVEYNFVLMLVEDDGYVKGQPASFPTKFRTEALPVFKFKDPSYFTVSYFFDPVKNVNDLSKASIKIDKKVMENPSCIKHIEVTGKMVTNVKSKPYVSGPAPSKNWVVSPELMYPDHHHGLGQHLGAHVAPPPSTPTKAPARGRRSLFSKKTTPPPSTPAPALLPTVTAKVLPPFLTDSYIEAVIDNVEPCKPYNFSLKFVGPSSNILAEVHNLSLALLSDMVDYHAPPLSKLFRVEAAADSPRITLQAGLGVPGMCLESLFEAVDRHMQRLEEDIVFHVAQEMQVDLEADYYETEYLKAQSNVLKASSSCKCLSPVVNVTGGEPGIRAQFPHMFGLYYFDGLHQSKPYFRTPSRHTDKSLDMLLKNAKRQTFTRTKRFIGKIQESPTGGRFSSTSRPYDPYANFGVTTTPTPPPIIRNIPIMTMAPPTTSRYDAPPAYPPPPPPTPAAAATTTTGAPYSSYNPVPTNTGSILFPTTIQSVKPVYYLYYDPSDKTWNVGDSLGESKPVLKTQKNSRALCPADVENAKTWTVSASMVSQQWSNDASIRVDCVPIAV